MQAVYRDCAMALENNKEHPARFANVINIGPELQYLCEQDTTNRMAFEYLMSGPTAEQ